MFPTGNYLFDTISCLMETFANWLQLRMDEKGYSQAELARRKTRATIRGLVARVIARRTDDQITGVMYCNQVNGQVPPWGSEPKTLFELQIPVRKRKAPLYTK